MRPRRGPVRGIPLSARAFRKRVSPGIDTAVPSRRGRHFEILAAERFSRQVTSASAQRAYGQEIGTTQAPKSKGRRCLTSPQETTMSKKAGKSLKEKRADKRTKADHTSATEDAIRKKR